MNGQRTDLGWETGQHPLLLPQMPFQLLPCFSAFIAKLLGRVVYAQFLYFSCFFQPISLVWSPSYSLTSFPPKFLVSRSPVVAMIPNESQPLNQWPHRHLETVLLASVPLRHLLFLLPLRVLLLGLPCQPFILFIKLAPGLHPEPMRTVTFTPTFQLTRCTASSYPSALSSRATSPQRLCLATLSRAALPPLALGHAAPFISFLGLIAICQPAWPMDLLPSLCRDLVAISGAHSYIPSASTVHGTYQVLSKLLLHE